MTLAAAPVPRRRRAMPFFNFWNVVFALCLVMIAVLLIAPLSEVFVVGFVDPETGGYTLANYATVLSHPYYLGALGNTMLVGVGGMVGACLIGVPLAYFVARFQVKARSLISTVAVLALVSPPFIGAYSWILVLGNNGWVTKPLRELGLAVPSIYGTPGIILVFTLKFFPFVYLMTESALRSINRSFEEAAANLGCSPTARFFRVTLPLVFPAVSSGAILAFVLSIADFGTPAIIGRNFRTLSTIAYNQYTAEMGGTPSIAVAISMLMIVISMAAVFLQRYFLSKRRYAGALTNLPEQKPLSGLFGVLVHAFCYLVVLLAALPMIVVFYTSILATSGPVFTGAFGLTSYARVWNELPNVVGNSFAFALAAVAMITVTSAFISYIVVRRETWLSGLLDSLLMVPYVVPGVVMAIGFALTFNRPPVDLIGTALIIILVVFIRRLPYGVRSTSSILRQIKPSIEEAAVNLGAPPALAFLKVTVPIMIPGIVVGAMMSFITAINELSSTLLLYTGATATMPIKIYSAVLDGEFGLAAALSTILLVSSGICVFIVFRLSENREGAFV
ncbi:ABC-type Fe3+ transport system, permease component [uncultured Pleomorphomonas sp.]|uniref:ABC-type Fe3+ transport system, permease component n=1 Tax=uncultured Pleomorphomonas sp. TaxID=442121 RepID=A0A212LF13_9HYPH|nr:iron ABC transporter permease [uncultured Pleomorphomonas sp.]SCM76154.1 ABC-type Fe3+ transport system, permease component [uncultured Pleomorphomonas sp.]